MREYYTYWSILDTPSNSTTSDSIFLILSFISLCALLSVLKFKKKDFEKKLLIFLTGTFLTLSVPAYIYLKFFVNDNTEKRLTEFLKSNRVKKVEGKIYNFQRVIGNPRAGKTTYESFEVDSVKFWYYDNALYQFNHFGGNNSKTLYENLNVKITYVEGTNQNEIQKIEIAKN
ncbi:hypothetical protein FCR2A7T_07090 [Flavobacterium cauense R2A-7]|nr:hypothetical protein FCR2A7T_07090 [Flavobacterium cauense R2A-7]